MDTLRQYLPENLRGASVHTLADDYPEALEDARSRYDAEIRQRLEREHPSVTNPSGEVPGTFEDIAPGKVFKGDPFRDGRSQTWVQTREAREGASSGIDGIIRGELSRHNLPHNLDGLRELRRGWTQPGSSADSTMLGILDESIARTEQWSPPTAEESWVLVEDKVRTTENGVTKFRTTKYVDPTDPDLGLYEGDENLKVGQPVEIEESELVSPEWMRSRGYDPESESDVRRMQQELNIRAWGNGVEAAMTVVPTKRTYMQTESGTPETVTYGPNGRDIVSVDFTRDGVPYREEYFNTGASGSFYTPDVLGDRVALGITGLPGPSRDYLDINEPDGYRLTRNPNGESPEVLDELNWNERLGSFVRTSGNRRWRISAEAADELAEYDEQMDAWESDPFNFDRPRPGQGRPQPF